jgi:DNA-binding MarR family transcriptional regulator
VPDLKPAGPAADRHVIDDWTTAAEVIGAVQQAVLARVAAAGVPTQWIAVLRLLHDAPDQRMTMSEIARDLAMSSGGFTKLADRMARDGLIDRRGVSTDRRVVHAVLTERGRILAEECTRAYNEAVSVLVLGAISDVDVQTLSRLAAKLSPVNDPDEPESAPDAFMIRPPSLASPDRRGQGAGTATRD